MEKYIFLNFGSVWKITGLFLQNIEDKLKIPICSVTNFSINNLNWHFATHSEYIHF